MYTLYIDGKKQITIEDEQYSNKTLVQFLEYWYAVIQKNFCQNDKTWNWKHEENI